MDRRGTTASFAIRTCCRAMFEPLHDFYRVSTTAQNLPLCELLSVSRRYSRRSTSGFSLTARAVTEPTKAPRPLLRTNPVLFRTAANYSHSSHQAFYLLNLVHVCMQPNNILCCPLKGPGQCGKFSAVQRWRSVHISCTMSSQPILLVMPPLPTESLTNST